MRGLFAKTHKDEAESEEWAPLRVETRERSLRLRVEWNPGHKTKGAEVQKTLFADKTSSWPIVARLSEKLPSRRVSSANN